MTPLRYFAFFAGTVALAVVSMLLTIAFNPVTWILYGIGLAAFDLFQRIFPVRGYNSWSAVMWISIGWPLMLAPLHYFNYRLGWKRRGFLMLFALAGGVLALACLIASST